MDERKKRELTDGHSYLTLSGHLSLQRIAEIAGVTEAEVNRLIALVRAEPRLDECPPASPV